MTTPKSTATQSRTRVLGLAVTSDEFILICAQASRRKMTVSSYLRSLALSDIKPPEVVSPQR